MRLLFDANLSPLLVATLADLFPQSLHVFDVGGLAGEDLEIWHYAKSNRLTIVSKDSDFHRMSFVLGPPPKVIWLRVGNCPTNVVEATLRGNFAEIALFDADHTAAFLVVD